MFKLFGKKNKKNEETDQMVTVSDSDNQGVTAGGVGQGDVVNEVVENTSSGVSAGSDNNISNDSASSDDVQQTVTDNQSGEDDLVTEESSGAVGGGGMASTAVNAMLSGGNISAMLDAIDTSQMSLKEKMALKMLKKLPPEKQEEVLRQLLNPQELYKHKDQIIKQIDAMVASGQIDKGRAEAIKAQLGLR